VTEEINISIVIVSYNVKELLCKCIAAAIACAGNLKCEIIVVDNNSLDGSVAEVRSQFPGAILIENKFNAGFSKANNQGMKIATGKYIFLLNPDTEITGDALQQLSALMELHDSCSVAAPQLLNSDKTIQPSVWKNHKVAELVLETFFLNKFFTTLNYPPEKLNTTFEGKTLSGAALFFRRSLLDKIGMLDENLFWMEDVDFCFRAQQHGSIMYLHTAKVIHHSGQSQKKNYNTSISNQLISKLKFYKKYSTMAARVVANFSCFIFIISRIIAFSLCAPLKKIYRLKAKAYSYTLKRYLSYLFLNDKSLA